MGCCQTSGLENEVIFDKSNSDSVPSFRPIHILHIPSDSEQKLEPTPSFGSGNKNFIFDASSKEKDYLEIN